MIKAVISYAKKEPADKEFSSRSYHMSLETELSDSASDTAIKDKVQATFALVRDLVEAELQGGNGAKAVAKPEASVITQPVHNGNRTSEPITNKQAKFLTDISRRLGMSLGDLNAKVKEWFGAETVYALTKKDASKAVDQLRQIKAA